MHKFQMLHCQLHQIGDYGIGFVENPIKDLYVAKNHRFIRGNHDDPQRSKGEINNIADGHVETIENNKVMFVGGASSIDRDFRIPGVSWWYDEELSHEELEEVIDLYFQQKPDVMVTHEVPNSVVFHFGLRILKDSARTREAFRLMFEIHKPKLWIFGHWHIKFDKVIDGTRFICVDQNHHVDIKLDEIPEVIEQKASWKL